MHERGAVGRRGPGAGRCSLLAKKSHLFAGTVGVALGVGVTVVGGSVVSVGNGVQGRAAVGVPARVLPDTVGVHVTNNTSVGTGVQTGSVGVGSGFAASGRYTHLRVVQSGAGAKANPNPASAIVASAAMSAIRNTCTDLLLD